MKSCALCLARLSAAAWVGAAVLFVVVSVREVTFPEFTSEVKDQLAVIRFPAYYLCGAGLIGVALVGTLLAGPPQLPRRQRWFAASLLALVVVEMAADYQFVYKPLEALVTPAGKVRTSDFVELHRWSTRLNTVNVALCLVAAGLLCWPGRAESAPHT